MCSLNCSHHEIRRFLYPARPDRGDDSQPFRGSHDSLTAGFRKTGSGCGTHCRYSDRPHRSYAGCCCHVSTRNQRAPCCRLSQNGTGCSLRKDSGSCYSSGRCPRESLNSSDQAMFCRADDWRRFHDSHGNCPEDCRRTGLTHDTLYKHLENLHSLHVHRYFHDSSLFRQAPCFPLLQNGIECSLMSGHDRLNNSNYYFRDIVYFFYPARPVPKNVSSRFRGSHGNPRADYHTNDSYHGTCRR